MRMPKPWPLAGLQEPDRRLDNLLQLLHAENDPALDRWAVDAVAEGRGLAVTLLEEDPWVEAQELKEALLTALAMVGQDLRQREPALSLIEALVRELHEQVEVWREEWWGLQKLNYTRPWLRT